MEAAKQFHVFGELVEILIPSNDVGGSFSMIVQTCPPGGGPPLHRHDDEDEIFRVLEGDFEIFSGGQWRKLAKGDYACTLRGSVHTFRNCGDTVGRMQAIIIPGKLDHYLEAIASLRMPDDGAKLQEISQAYGIHFLESEAPEVAPL